jgi:hypothetical protein
MGTDKDSAKYKPWMPASVQKKYKQLSMKFIKAEYLPQMDVNLFSDAIGDPYIWINHMGTKMKTATKLMERDGENPWAKAVTWDQEVLLPIELPLANDNLKFLFYDYDTGMGDDLICAMNFSLK